MGYCIRTDLARHLHKSPGDQRTCQSGGQGIATLIKSVGTDGGKGEFFDERPNEIPHQRLTGTSIESLTPNRLQLIALAEVSCKGDHLLDTPLLLEIRNADTRIHAAGISKHNLLGASHQADS